MNSNVNVVISKNLKEEYYIYTESIIKSFSNLLIALNSTLDKIYLVKQLTDENEFRKLYNLYDNKNIQNSELKFVIYKEFLSEMKENFFFVFNFHSITLDEYLSQRLSKITQYEVYFCYLTGIIFKGFNFSLWITRYN